jgi:hypothetical protein
MDDHADRCEYMFYPTMFPSTIAVVHACMLESLPCSLLYQIDMLVGSPPCRLRQLFSCVVIVAVTNETNNYYGGAEPRGSNIYFSDFSDDPWQQASVRRVSTAILHVVRDLMMVAVGAGLGPALPIGGV